MERLIALEGCHNFRDLGGYPARDGKCVRWRTLFRSDGLHLLSAADVTRLREEIGLRHMIDLRSSGELRIDGVGPLADEPVRHHHVPLFDGEMRDLASRITRDAMVSIVTAKDDDALELLRHDAATTATAPRFERRSSFSPIESALG